MSILIADLHVHTNHTDCSDSPDFVFQMAKANGLNALAITDHDTLYGMDINQKAANKYGVEYIPGIEVSAYDYKRNKRCHIIGLHAKRGYKPLEDLIDNTVGQRREHSLKQIRKLQQMGYDISPDDFKEKTSCHGIYKQHIMHVLIGKGIVKDFFGDFYEAMFKNGGPLAMEIEYPSHIEATKALRESGAFPVLAHPTLYDNIESIQELKDNGLLGMEVWYPAAAEDQINELIEIGKQYDLFLSAGSDYHGLYDGGREGYVGSHFVTDIRLLSEYR